jgi:hypothetical protein
MRARRSSCDAEPLGVQHGIDAFVPRIERARRARTSADDDGGDDAARGLPVAAAGTVEHREGVSDVRIFG